MLPQPPFSFDIPATERLLGIRRGIEKEGLRVLPDGSLALTPHPQGLGSPLTHPLITTDYSEAQLELITGAHLGVEDCLDELRAIHHYVYGCLQEGGDEMIWAASMPCTLPTDETIPLARYGNSHVGRSKSIYRMGLGQRYGRRMQTISGIHYNWSLPGLGSEDYFALIRNFRRHAFVLLYLFGASPTLCPCFAQDRQHGLLDLGEQGQSLYLPYATSLRMGRLGYQSDAQSNIHVSYNSLEGYANSLHEALTHPYPPYEQLGVRNPGGDYNQLDTSLLQIENEFYSSVRPKRNGQRGERPLHALRERGVEYVEVRLMDINPFEPLGISASTMRMLDVFLLHCLLSPSPADTPEEVEALNHNQQLTADRGRDPSLTLQRGAESVRLVDWATAILEECQPLAAALDAAHHNQAYSAALGQAQELLRQPQLTPSARVLEGTRAHGNSFKDFGLTQSLHTREQLLSLPRDPKLQATFAQLSAASIQAQREIEAADQGSFEEWRQAYLQPENLL
ncbi:MAG: glutamate--cysteine ligase [Comamonas sp.]|nr:glutamate--cysteine ligase [Comamonas sp.]